MKIYIDLFFLFNIIMDYIIITSVSILLKRKTTVLRVIISSVVGGISSLIMFTGINSILIEILSVIVMVLIAFKYIDIRYTIKNIFYMYILSVLLGGIIYLFNIRVTSNPLVTYLIIIIISIEVMILYIKENKSIKNIYNNYYDVDICFKDGDKLSLVGFMDTGNNLYDPYFNRPIIILNKGIDLDLKKVIFVPFETLNSKGIMKCFLVDKIFIRNIGYRENVLIGLSNDKFHISGVDIILHRDLMEG